MTMAAAADFPTGEMAPADATFCGSLFFFAHAAETVSDATTDAATEMVTAAGSSLSFCSFAAAQETDADADVTWTPKRAGLLSIIQKNAENVVALIQQEGDETCLTRLMDAVTVTSEYKYFNIIEP